MAKSHTDILTDFKQAALNSVRRVYPNTELKGCFYHFSSNIWKHIQNFGKQNNCQDDENFALWLRLFSALAFVPPNDVVHFELLIDEIRSNFNDECDDLIDCFEDTHISICFIKFIILRARVLREPANHAPFLPILYKANIIKNYSISFIFAFQQH